MNKIPAVVIPADRPAALGIARSLGRRGIQVYGVDSNPRAIGMVSRYLKACPLPNCDDSDENRLKFLVDLGKKLEDKAVLYPLRDDDVILCSRERSELQKYYLYVMPSHDTVMNLVTKDGLYHLGQTCEIPTPRIYIPNDIAHLESIADSLPFPVILKPVFSPSWLRPEIISLLRDNPLSNPSKVALCRNVEELRQTYLKVASYDKRMIIQEVIAGEDERLAYFCFYIDHQSRPLATFAGRKLRLLPVGFGSATYVRSFYDPDLEEVSFKLLSRSKYVGLGGIEFKKDPRDEKYKLIEFNARFGMWDSLSARCGIDIPYIAYCDALGLPVKAQHNYRVGIAWVDLHRDIRAFLIYHSRRQLSLKGWLKSLLGEKDGAVYSADDWKPAIIANAELLERGWNWLTKKLSISSKVGTY